MEASAVPTPGNNNRSIVVRDRLTLGNPGINTDFLYSPFKGGQSVLGNVQNNGQKMTYPIPHNMRVAMGLPQMSFSLKKKAV